MLLFDAAASRCFGVLHKGQVYAASANHSTQLPPRFGRAGPYCRCDPQNGDLAAGEQYDLMLPFRQLFH
jgi:hypothetical protein